MCYHPYYFTFFLSGVGIRVLSFIEMYVSLLRLGLSGEQVDCGESSQPWRPSARPALEGGDDTVLIR